eukprot:13165842-Heterocapsa_arctica.AAC.1
MSGLKLNMYKTVLVPLFLCRLDAFRHKLCTPPPELIKAQDSLLRKLVLRPGDWTHKEDLFVLNSEL